MSTLDLRFWKNARTLIPAAILSYSTYHCLYALKWPRPVSTLSVWRLIQVSPLLLIFYISRVHEAITLFLAEVKHALNRRSALSSASIDAARFAGHAELDRLLDIIGGSGPRLTGNDAHARLIVHLQDELAKIKGLTVESHSANLLRWQPDGDQSLHDIADLSLNGHRIEAAGAVPYSKPTAGASGELLYVPGREPLTAATAGKIVLRDFPSRATPFVLPCILSHWRTPDLERDLISAYDRPGLADEPLHRDMLEAGRLGAKGIIFMFDLPTSQVDSYFDPHKGCHYALPALFVGKESAALLKATANDSPEHTVRIVINATTFPGNTRSLIATLPGMLHERVIFVSHTDGNTYIQENGPAALLTLAKYFASVPITQRRRTIQFAFNSGHLHISREMTYAHSQTLNQELNAPGLDRVVLTIPVEHLGPREIEAVPSPGGQGRELQFTGRGELMFWCCGPSPNVVKAVKTAVKRRGLDRVMVTRGVSLPAIGSVPVYTSFGGIGTYYHNSLVPTTSLISGPWSLWAPHFSKQAVDVDRLRKQILAIGDVYFAIDQLPWQGIIGGYQDYRRWRQAGKKSVSTDMPAEMAADCAFQSDSGVVQY